MILWSLITQPASAFREFVAPRYRPELHYMRGPGPAYARRAVMVGARNCVVDCHLWPLCRCHINCVIDDRTKPAPSGVFAGMTLLTLVAAALVTAALVGVWVFLMHPMRGRMTRCQPLRSRGGGPIPSPVAPATIAEKSLIMRSESGLKATSSRGRAN